MKNEMERIIHSHYVVVVELCPVLGGMLSWHSVRLMMTCDITRPEIQSEWWWPVISHGLRFNQSDDDMWYHMAWHSIRVMMTCDIAWPDIQSEWWWPVKSHGLRFNQSDDDLWYHTAWDSVRVMMTCDITRPDIQSEWWWYVQHK